jgi:ATP-dependent DNA helicase RecG
MRNRMVSRRYRNRRIGEFLKELDFTEGRGTGVPKMRRALKVNGSPEPVFFTDDERLSFWTEIKIHPEFLREQTFLITQQVTGQVTGQVTIEILIFCQEPRKAREIQNILKLKHRETFQNNYLRPLLNAQLLSLTIPDKPQSRLQKYMITKQGRKWLRKNG